MDINPMARDDGKRKPAGRSTASRTGNSGDTDTGSGSSGPGSSGSADSGTGSIDGLSGIGGAAHGENGNNGDSGNESQVHSRGSNVDGAHGAGSTGGDGNAAGDTGNSGSGDGAARKRGRPRNPDRSPELVPGAVHIGDVKAPSDLSYAKLGRKKKTANKQSVVAGVGLGLDALFALQKYRLGPGFEFWELNDAEKNDLAQKFVACLDALPSGKANKAVAWMVEQIERYAPFGALAWAGYSAVGWRIEMTKTVQATRRSVANDRNNSQQGDRNVASVNGAAHDTGAGIQAEAGSGHSDGSTGVGPTGAAPGDVASLFAAPPHIRA